MEQRIENATRLAAYIPRRLQERIIKDGLPIPGQARRFTAATLFCDLSGFTNMAEELASDGPRGAEELNRVLLVIFTAMISLIHDAGGYVGHFYGDAMSVIFPEDTSSQNGKRMTAVHQAWRCGRMMQRVMTASLSRVITNRPSGKDPLFRLTMRVGLGYGECVELVVGDPTECLEYVIGGPAIDEAVTAEKKAQVGQVLAAESLLQKAGIDPKQELKEIPQTFSSFSEQQQGAKNSAELAAIYARFLHPALADRLAAAGADFLAEHRPVSSMFVQFEGIDFTAEDVGNRLQLYYEWARETIDRYGGANSRLNRVLTGDKGNQLHIIFGAPVAPDSPGQAIRCGLALLREKPAFITAQKIGLAVGKVFACPVGSEARREYTVVGDVVNLSARLAQECNDNSLLVDKVALDRCHTWLEYETLPPVTVKGKQEPVKMYRAIGERLPTSKLQVHFGRWQRPIFGREDELEMLLGSMETAFRGIGGAISLSGALGIGKSRLLAEGGRFWLDQGGQALIGDCQPHTNETPFGPWLEIWREFFDLRPEMPEAAQAKTISDKIQRLYPEAGADSALWGEVLGVEIDTSESLDQLPADVRQARFFNLVRQCFQNAARLKPLFIALEDVHWADQASLDLIDVLADYLQDSAIFIVVTYRPSGEPDLDLLKRPICIPISLGDLSPDKAREMALSLMGVAELPPKVERPLGLRDRDGLSSPVNPLFLEEALRVMLENKVITIQPGSQNQKVGRVQVDEERLEQMEVPDTIHGLLLARLDGLPAASRDVLQIASVIGRQFALDILSKITPRQPQGNLMELLDGLSLVEMVQLIHADPELTYLFQHAMTQEVAYESLAYARRQVLHAAIADWLLERYHDNLRPFYQRLAHHYSHTDIHDKGLKFSVAAADDARDIYANREAVELYRMAENHLLALGAADHRETAVHIYLSRGEVHKLLGDFASATADIKSALDHLAEYDRPNDRATACNLLAEIRYRQGNFAETQALTNGILEQKGDLAITANQLARAYIWHGMASAALLKYDTALEYLHEAEGICLANHEPVRLSGALEALAFIHYSRQELDKALDVMQRGVVIKRDYDTPEKYAKALNNVALIQSSMGSPEEALETWDRAANIAENTSRNAFAIILSNRAEILSYVGRFDEAERDFQQAVNLFASMDDQYSLAMAHLLWGYEYSLVRKQWEAAKVHFDRACAIFDAESDSYPEETARLLLGLGCLEQAVGKEEKAAIHFSEALALIRGKGLKWWQPAGHYFMGLSYLNRGDLEMAGYHFNLGVETAEDRGCPDYLPLALLGMGMTESDPTRRRDYLNRCIKTADLRSRYSDRLYCQKTARKLLKQMVTES